MKADTTVATLAALLLASCAVTHAQGDPASLASTRETLSKWVETQQILSKEKRDWQTGRDILAQRIAMLEGEIAATEAKIAESKGVMAEAERGRRTVVDKSQDLRAATSALADAIGPTEAKTRRLLATLPEPLTARIAPLAGRLPAEGAGATGSLSERWQNVVGILNEVNKFGRDITVASELRDLPGGGRAEVQSVYLGLAQAYYVSPKGDAAGVGRPTADGWVWTAANDLAPQVTRVLAILRNENVPTLVPLPVEIR